ncbi:hypothetical protein KY331_00700 [Candidatus Woesearchaeota archaeon]|nr:hypothetical protein [Candidatus Woesearchaeota archaeon]
MMANRYAEQTQEQRAEEIRNKISVINGYGNLLENALSAVFTEQGRANFDRATRDAGDVLEYDECKNGFDVLLASVSSYLIQDAVGIDRKLKQGQKPIPELERLVFAGVLGKEGIRKAVEKYYYHVESESHLSLPHTYDSLEHDIENAKKEFEERYKILLEQKHDSSNLIRYLAQREAEKLYESKCGDKQESEEERKEKIKKLYDRVIEGVRSIKDKTSDEDLIRRYKGMSEAEIDSILSGRDLVQLPKDILEKLIRKNMSQGERFALDYCLLKRKHKNQNGRFNEKLGSVLNVWVNEGFGAECKNYVAGVLRHLEIAKRKYIGRLEEVLNPKPEEKSISPSAKALAMVGIGSVLALAIIAYSQFPSWVKGNPVVGGRRNLSPNTFEVVNFYDVDKDGDLDMVDVRQFRIKGEEAERKGFKTWLTPEFAEERYIFSWFYGEVMTPEELEEAKKNFKRLSAEKKAEEAKRKANSKKAK